jgi:hypothetical protein
VYRRKGHASLIDRRLLRTAATGVAIVAGWLAATGGLVAACGGSDSSGSDAQEVQEIADLIESAKPGEYLILSSGSIRDGPYKFKPGGYVFSFQQTDEPARLVVSLQSKPGSRDEPYQLLIDTTALKGSEQVSLTGRLYVDVVSEGSYLLRFTPRG